MSEQLQTADILDFWKGGRFIKGLHWEILTKRRQFLSTEAGRLEMIRLREIADRAGPPEPQTA
jgi:hypothetical protein